MNRFVRSMLMWWVLALTGTAACAAAANTNADYGRLVDAVIAHYHLPGIAVGVIDRGKVVYTHTAGTRPSGKPIDADTIFKLGSVSKAFTVTLLARLVQQGKLKWTDPVTEYLPGFAMYDPWVTRHMQVADLAAHHSGLHEFAGDLMLWPHPSHFTPADVIHGLRYLKPSYGFRGGYSYDNVLFVVAGQVATAAAGTPYAELVRREVFQPLGLSRCEVGTWNRERVGNVAQPHTWRDGHFVAEGNRGAISHAATMDAAGGIQCSLDDMLAWARNWLTPTPRQLQWLSPAQRRSEWMPYTVVPISTRRRDWNDPGFVANAHGWFVSDPDGHIAVWHTGVLGGIRAALVLLPYRQSGFVILLNAGSDDALAVLQEELLKQLVAPGERRSVTWYADYLAREEAKGGKKPVPDTSARQPATPAELKAQLGVWRDPWFGKVLVCAHGKTVHFSSQMSPLLAGQVMRVGSQYLVQWKNDEAPDAWLEFPAHAGDTLHMALVDPNADASSDFHDLDFARAGKCP
jgi:CubicO group peptidase (beta-lactamase class C family)